MKKNLHVVLVASFVLIFAGLACRKAAQPDVSPIDCVPPVCEYHNLDATASAAVPSATARPTWTPAPLTATPSAIPTDKLPEAVTVSGAWNCRADANILADVIVQIPDGGVVLLLGETSGGWNKVRYVDEYAERVYTCWIAGW